MAYTATSDVNNRLGALFTVSENSTPNIATVALWGDELDALFNQAATRAGYSTPVSGTNDLLIARRLVANLLALMVLETALPTQRIPERFKAARDEWHNALKMIVEGELPLIDQTIDNSANFTGYLGTLSLNTSDTWD
jgi:hypothetical protein